MSVARDHVRSPREAIGMGLGLGHQDRLTEFAGEVFFEMRDTQTGEVIFTDHRKNVITLDAGILAAMLFKNPSSRLNGANMLAVGTGGIGAPPAAPTAYQRSLNNELTRKPWSSTTFRDSMGAAVAIPTNIVDFTCTYTESEAVGALNEMGILATVSTNPLTKYPNTNNPPAARDTSIDVAGPPGKDILVNYLTFPQINKPNTATLAITWRITF